MSRHELYAAATLVRVMNATAGKDEKPFKVDLPWESEAEKTVDVTPEERQSLQAQLRASSAFGQLRTETP